MKPNYFNFTIYSKAIYAICKQIMKNNENNLLLLILLRNLEVVRGITPYKKKGIS
tara:strand:- start:34 stop:198 length:165 start_codon:yes stop_codon:yes gene_type:complete